MRLDVTALVAAWLTGLALLAAAAPGVVGESLFREGVEYAFRWHAQVDTGTRLPSHSLSHWQLDANLRVQGLPTGALVQIHDLRTSLWNGEVGSQPLEAESQGEAVRGDPLLGAFKLAYAGGRVTTVELVEEEPLWAHNMKRAVASLLQLDLQAARNPAQPVVEVTEVGPESQLGWVVAKSANDANMSKERHYIKI